MQIIKICTIWVWILLSPLVLCASAEDTAKELGLSPAKKAIVQWERVFKSERKLKRYGINVLSKEQQQELLIYLINHAADSDHPTVSGM